MKHSTPGNQLGKSSMWSTDNLQKKWWCGKMTSWSRPLFNLTFVLYKFLGALDSSINFHGFIWEICVMNVSIGRLDSEMYVCAWVTMWMKNIIFVTPQLLNSLRIWIWNMYCPYFTEKHQGTRKYINKDFEETSYIFAFYIILWPWGC